MKDKKYREVRYCFHYAGEYRLAVHSILNLKYNVPKKIYIFFCDGSSYYYHFIIKHLAEKLKSNLLV